MHIRFLIIFSNVATVAMGMFHKRTVPDAGEEATGAKRLRSGLHDVFLGNELSANKVQYLAQAGHDAGLDHLRDIALAVGRGNKSRKNIHRNILNAFSKRCQWPGLYYAPVRVWSLKQMKEVTVQLPFQLPHELLRALASHNSVAALANQASLSASTKAHVAGAAAALGVRPEELISLGIWGDGVPCNWDRSQSMDMFTMFMPGLPPGLQELRVPLCALNMKYVVVGNTFDDICAILAWSFQQCALGKMPSCRHDGSQFNKTDCKRKLQANTAIPRAILAEVKGDWAFFKQCFRYPQHNEKGGICFRCRTTPGTYKDCSSTADWRTQRLDHWALMARFLERGIDISPIFDCPFLKSTCFLMDWLHVADLGITPNFLGSLLLLLLTKFPGQNSMQRCFSMYGDLSQWYKDHGTESKLDQLTPSMLKSSKKPPHLRGKGAEIRALVPWANELAQRLLRDDDTEEQSAKVAMFHLNACYSMLSAEKYDEAVLQEHSRKFALLYVGLDSLKADRWHVVPKLHWFQEMCEMTSVRPSNSWNYRDESFGGYLAGLSRLRGGHNTASAAGKSMLRKFQARHRIPLL